MVSFKLIWIICSLASLNYFRVVRMYSEPYSFPSAALLCECCYMMWVRKVVLILRNCVVQIWCFFFKWKGFSKTFEHLEWRSKSGLKCGCTTFSNGPFKHLDMDTWLHPGVLVQKCSTLLFWFNKLSAQACSGRCLGPAEEITSSSLIKWTTELLNPFRFSAPYDLIKG